MRLNRQVARAVGIAAVAVFAGAATGQPIRRAACPAGGCFSTLPSGGDILYTQIDDPSGYAFTDQEFEAVYAAYDCEGADDFEITDAAGWDISEIITPGLQTAGGAPSYTSHFFYEDAGGLPGSPVDDCDFPANTNFVHDQGNLLTQVACRVGSGVYWFSQQVRQDFVPSGQHLWATRLGTVNDPAAFRNPGNGFGFGCVDWAPANAVCGMTGSDFQFAFVGGPASIGDCLGDPAVCVPALGPLGATLICLALGAAGAWVLRRRG